jgi:hypothetical protein
VIGTQSPSRFHNLRLPTILVNKHEEEFQMRFAIRARFGSIPFALVVASSLATAQSPIPQSNTQAASQQLQVVDQLIEQNKKLETQNQELMKQIESLRSALAPGTSVPPSPEETQTPSASVARPVHIMDDVQESVEDLAKTDTTAKEESEKWGSYTPNLGFRVANTEYGDLNVSLYTYVRYLNQLGLRPTYTNYFGTVSNIQQRQDLQLNKVQIKFLGWIMNPSLRYFLYAWSSNVSQGLPAQVVLAGNLTYSFNDHINIGGGIRSLPGTRSVEGNFPFWLGVDSRLMADEFFRPSYTSGVWAWGRIAKRVDYMIMDGNNLSTLGVSAAQLNNKFDTLATALIWMPTTGEFGRGFGDFEDHQKLATRFAGHFTRSNEDAQEQPNSDQFENTQIRLEDGTVVFTPNIFGPGITVNNLRYRMAAFDAGIKKHGFSLAGEYFLRWLDEFQGPGISSAGLPTVFSHGYQLQTSQMLIPKTFQVYLGGSTLAGKYGNPWDFRAGINWYPYKNRVLRWNNEFLYVRNSAVGYTALPYPLGGNGPIFASNVELAF